MPPLFPKTVLVVFDGFGESAAIKGNAIRLAATPHYDRLLARYPHTLLEASGEDVGLPAGLMGNSEVGHLNLGAGRIVYQDILRITRSIRDGSLFENEALVGLADRVKQTGQALHLMGLVSDGGVHSLDLHLVALLELAKRRGVADVRVHAFLDGRDTSPQSALEHLRKLEQAIGRIGIGRIVTVSGRYFAMDRDKRWDRTKLAWDAIVLGRGERADSAEEAVKRSYEAGRTDEFVRPVIIAREGVEPARLEDGAGMIFFNFRADRARQVSAALTEPSFDGFARERFPAVTLVTMTEYDPKLGLEVAFPKVRHHGILADVLAQHEIPNLRLSETEKYAHVTYFFNGGVEAPWPCESRLLVPSPKVATYDLEPEMSAATVTDRLVAALGVEEHRVIIVNYPNADMVGHTGVLDATVRAVEVLDICLGRIMEAVEAARATLLLTADHGNAEQMLDPETGGPHTAHTTNPVPLVVASPTFRGRLASGGKLADVVPTLLDLHSVAAPPEMTARSLLERDR